MLERYVASLLEWNSKINLVSRADVENIWFSHILHSLSILFFVDFPRDARVLDLGTGGGLPGIPISVARPDIRMTLLDSIRKKTTAVQDTIDKLQLHSVQVVTGRAEEVAREREFSSALDVVVSRAVAPLIDLIKWSRPFIKKTGKKAGPMISDNKVLNGQCLLALKGGDLTSELEVARLKSGLRQHSIINLVFEGSDEVGLQEKKIIIVPF